MIFNTNALLFVAAAASMFPNFAMSSSHVDPASSDMEWYYGSGGTFLQCSDTDYPFMVGLCGSSDESSCKGSDGKSYATAMACGDYPDEKYPQQAADPSIAKVAKPGYNGWTCFSNGDHGECPYGQAIVGLCGSLGSDNCQEQCASTDSFGLLCGTTPSGYYSLNDPQQGWQTPQARGAKVTCPEGSVACGACMSDKHTHCDGNYSRLKCCEASPFSVDGSWVYQFQVSATTSSTMHWGMDKTQDYTKTSQWSDAVTAGANANFGVGGVSVSNTFTTTYGNSYSYSWTTSESQDFQVSYDQDQVGQVVWQWVTTVVDNQGTTSNPLSTDFALTPSRTIPPKCYPGYAASDDFQTCDSGFYLPGYEPSSGRLLSEENNATRGNLRGEN